MNLLDANVWFAGIWDGHTDHQRALTWRKRADGPLAMCRVTQMTVLRLLTTGAAMGGRPQTRREAWLLVDQQLADPDVAWIEEPAGMEDIWRLFSALDDRNHKLWTDDYLAAFARAAGMRLVTLDRALVRRYPSVEVEAI